MAKLPNPLLDEKNEIEGHSIFTKIGGLLFRVYRSFDKTKSNVVRDDSYIELSNNEKAQSKIRISSGGHILINAAENLTLGSSKHFNLSIKGNKQEVVSGSSTSYSKGDVKNIKGKQGDSEVEAAKKLQEATAKIQEARLSAMDKKGEMVACPVCNVTHLVDNHSSLVQNLFTCIRKYVIPYFCFPLDVVEFLAKTLISPILTPKKNLALTGSSGCGSPACKGGQIESPVAATKAADKATAQAIKDNSENISKYSKQLGAGGAEIIPYKTDVVFKSGLKKNTVPAYKKKGHNVFGLYFMPGKNGNGHVLAMGSKGSCEKVVFCPPQRTHGSVMFDVANNFTINAGSPGVDIQTSGRFNVMAGDMVLNANEGEAVFGSANVTTIKGKNIIMDANDMSGDSGFVVQSQHTMVNGSFNVRGDAAFKGHVTMDGALSCPYLIVPSMRTETTAGSPSKFKVEGANWVGTAAALSIGNLTKDLAFRYLMSGYIMTPSGIYSLICEIYDSIMMAMTAELVETGYGIGEYFITVWNFKHNHTKVGEDHSHSTTVPKASFWNDRKAWGQERMGGSPIPTPSPVHGDTSSPGPKSKAGGCGGGGLYTKNRNEKYGLNALDPYSGLNYIPYNIKRDSGGNLIPPPQFSVVYGDTTTTPITGNYTIPANTLPASALNC
jgi:hypothetical protein